MKTLLLCGYRASDHEEDILGLIPDANGLIQLDRQIQTLKSLGLGVVCVLGGNGAEEQLRTSRLLQDTELVFDTNDAETSLASNLRAGSKALEGEACYVLPVEIPAPERELWEFLRNEWGKIGF